MSAQKAIAKGEYKVNPSRTGNDKDTFSEEITPNNNNGYIIYECPMPVSGSMDKWRLNHLSKERFSAFKIPYKVNESYEFTIKLDGVKSVTKNVCKSVKNSVGYANISIVNENDKILVKRSISLNMDIIPANKYKEFLEIMRQWNNTNWRNVVVKEL